MSSIFTKIIEREIPASIIYEDEKHIAFLDLNPLEKGHTLVIPKKEYETIFDMPEDEFLELQKIVLKISKHFENVLWSWINILQSNKAIAWQEVFHVHFHVVPRLTEKKVFNFNAWDTYIDWEKDEYRDKLALIK